MVGEHLPGAARGLRVADDLADAVEVAGHVEVQGLGRQVGHAGAVREDVGDGDRVLPVPGVLGDVLADAVAEVDRALAVEDVGDGRRNRLRGRVDGERRLRPRRDTHGVVRVAGAVATLVADRTIEDHGALAAHADRDRRMYPAAVQPLDRGPDRLDRIPRHSPVSRVRLVRDAGQWFEVLRDLDAGILSHQDLVVEEFSHRIDRQSDPIAIALGSEDRQRRHRHFGHVEIGEAELAPEHFGRVDNRRNQAQAFEAHAPFDHGPGARIVGERDGQLQDRTARMR